MTDVMAKYGTRRVPRYTSYPTAPHFQTEFPAATYGQWLGALDADEPVSLYLHLPFCSQVCWYCGCNMKLASRYEPVAAYVETLLEEIELVAATLPAKLKVSHLHWGGGTPTTLKPDDLERVMERLGRHFDFGDNAELCIEVDPRTLTQEMTARIGTLGFTRASFGVQEFDDRVQAAINRIQPPELVRDTVWGLHAAGVTAINFDLIYGLPHQTVDTLTRTVETCLDMAPNRFAVFGYAHVPWMAKKQRLISEDALPDAVARTAQATAAADVLTGAGYTAIGLDHFARPDDSLAVAYRSGTLRRNFQGYTTDRADTLIGLGATSIGRTPGGYIQNISETGAWTRAVRDGRLPVGKGLALSADDLLRAYAIERLMCDGALDTRAVAQRFGVDDSWCGDARNELLEMRDDGLLELDGARVRLTDKGLPLARCVAAAFDSYLQHAPARHSAAV